MRPVGAPASRYLAGLTAARRKRVRRIVLWCSMADQRKYVVVFELLLRLL